MGQLHYLTVQDVLWINLQATKKVQHYNFAKLEEATYYQYAYGESNELLPQAARFLTGFLRMHPFEAGNEVTAFVAFAGFLRINGLRLNVNDDSARAWFEGIKAKPTEAGEALAKATVASEETHLTVREALGVVLDEYTCTVLNLVKP